MNGEHARPISDAELEQAVAWLVRVGSDDADHADWMALADWLEQLDTHRAAFDAAERLSGEIDVHRREIDAALPRTRVIAHPPTSRRRPQPRPRRAWLAAAAVAAAAVVAPFLLAAVQGAPVTYQTRPGQTLAVTLTDGGRVRLDGASRMVVRMGWFERRVRLADAQAAFEVVHDAARPFVVQVGDEQARDVGTEFNVRHFGSETVITVRRGAVDVRPAAVTLSAGDQLSHADGSGIWTRERVDPDVAFGWTQGRLVCDDWSLRDVVAYLNRRYAVPIRLSPAVADRRFSGVLELVDEDVLVRRLAGYASLALERRPGSFTLR